VYRRCDYDDDDGVTRCGVTGEVQLTAEQAEYVEDLQGATLAASGVSIAAEECLGWLEADLTVDQAVGWMNHGCGPGDAAGCWTQDPNEAFSTTGDV
jgi:hypothetical protein